MIAVNKSAYQKINVENYCYASCYDASKVYCIAAEIPKKCSSSFFNEILQKSQQIKVNADPAIRIDK